MHYSPLPVAPGDVLAGKYRIERVLGMGGMGVVVAARHLELGELFAIKFLLPQALANAQAVERFLREARAAARLKGEHVAKVTDVGRLETGAPYMVMEHLDGTDLQKHVRSVGPLPFELAVTYLLQACDAIMEAHALGIVHRDIKPANLFLTRRPNGTPCVKVLDFGISKQTAPDGVDLTKTGSVLGSPLYMAPEQMARTKEADARCDVWSLGIVFHELLTGKVPFYAETITEVVARVLQEEPVPPSRLQASVPPAADAIVARCLQKRPEHRFQTITELAAALRTLERGAAVGSTLPLDAPSPMGRLSSPSLPGPIPASTASAWGTTGASSPQKKTGVILAALSGVLLLGLLGGGAYLVLGAKEGATPTAAAGASDTAQPVIKPAAPPSAGPVAATAEAPAGPGTQAPEDPTITPAPPAPTAAPSAKSTATVKPAQVAAAAKSAPTKPTPTTPTAPAAPATTTKKKREGVW